MLEYISSSTPSPITMTTSTSNGSTPLVLVLVGAQRCGKTALLERFTGATYRDDHEGTVGVDCMSRVLEVDGTLVTLNLWDTSGQQAFLWTAKKHLQQADGVLFVYDVTDTEGFSQLQGWLELVNRCVKAHNLPKVLVGTKLDLKHKQAVAASQAKEFGIPEGMQHVEVSAKMGKNVNVPFYMLAKEVLRWRRVGCGLKLGVPSPIQQYGEPSVIELAEKVEEEADPKEYTHLFKILVMGGPRVGKTAARYRFCREYYTSEYHATSGLEYSTRTVKIDGDMVKLQIWDIGGDPVYDATRKNYYRGANGFIVMYDETSPKSFETATKLIKELDMYEQSDSPKIVLGNKCDIESSRPRVDDEEARAWADGWRLPLIQASARTGHNVDSAFLKLAVALKRKMAPWKRLYNFDK